MAPTLENKRSGREEELRNKLQGTLDRFEAVFNKPLSVKELLSYLADAEKENKNIFLKDRIGVLSDADIAYLRRFIKTSLPTHQVEDPIDLEDLGEIGEDDNEA